MGRRAFDFWLEMTDRETIADMPLAIAAAPERGAWSFDPCLNFDQNRRGEGEDCG
jgi:hypothetical protein